MAKDGPIFEHLAELAALTVTSAIVADAVDDAAVLARLEWLGAKVIRGLGS